MASSGARLQFVMAMLLFALESVRPKIGRERSSDLEVQVEVVCRT